MRERNKLITVDVNMCNDIVCDENGSGSDIDDVVCNTVLYRNTPEQVFEPCPSDTLYTVDHKSPSSGLLSKRKKLFLKGWENLPREKLR